MRTKCKLSQNVLPVFLKPFFLGIRVDQYPRHIKTLPSLQDAPQACQMSAFMISTRNYPETTNLFRMDDHSKTAERQSWLVISKWVWLCISDLGDDKLHTPLSILWISNVPRMIFLFFYIPPLNTFRHACLSAKLLWYSSVWTNNCTVFYVNKELKLQSTFAQLNYLKCTETQLSAPMYACRTYTHESNKHNTEP